MDMNKFTKAQLIEFHETERQDAREWRSKYYDTHRELAQLKNKGIERKNKIREKVLETVNAKLSDYADKDAQFLARLEFEHHFGDFTAEALATVTEVREYLGITELENLLIELESIE